MQIRIIFLTILNIFIGFSCAREGNPYSRVNTNTFQVASKSFVSSTGNGPKVTLLGVIHIADEKYYGEIQNILNKADLVLYEGIGTQEENDEVKKNCPEISKKGINSQHENTARKLRLVFQQKIIKQGDNFVHADASLMSLLDERGIAINKPLCERLRKQYVTDPFEDDSEITPNRHQLAFILTKNLSHERNEFTTKDVETILFFRNGIVIEALKKHLPLYTPDQEIVIFYGAGHMPDIENSLKDLDYSLNETRWFSAFELLD